MKIIRVRNCEECPYHHSKDWRNGQKKYLCVKSDMGFMIRGKEIPEWCPLEDDN